jgi:hypothetical protein
MKWAILAGGSAGSNETARSPNMGIRIAPIKPIYHPSQPNPR